MRMLLVAFGCGALMIAVSTLAPAPVSGDSRYTLVPRPFLNSPTPGRATVVLVREQFARAKPLDAKKLFLDGRLLGLLAQKCILTLTRAGLEWQHKGERFVLQWSRVSRIRFAGSRFYEENPWVGFQHVARDGSTMTAAFTDQREPSMARTYARIFAVSRRPWRDAKVAGRNDAER